MPRFDLEKGASVAILSLEALHQTYHVAAVIVVRRSLIDSTRISRYIPKSKVVGCCCRLQHLSSGEIREPRAYSRFIGRKHSGRVICGPRHIKCLRDRDAWILGQIYLEYSRTPSIPRLPLVLKSSLPDSDRRKQRRVDTISLRRSLQRRPSSVSS